MIKRIAQTAGFTGLLAALLLTLLQSFWVSPLILQAETYEKSEPAAVAVTNTRTLKALSPPIPTMAKPGSRKTAGSACYRPPVAIWWWRSVSP
jgi:predicted cobalt transporter CbtA